MNDTDTSIEITVYQFSVFLSILLGRVRLFFHCNCFNGAHSIVELI